MDFQVPIQVVHDAVVDAHTRPTVPSFFPDFESAASTLRTLHKIEGALIPPNDDAYADSKLWTELQMPRERAQEILAEFFDILRETADEVKGASPGRGRSNPYAPTVFVVEGLDGSGKSTLVGNFAARSAEVRTTQTPPPSLRRARPIFDCRRGAVARAFYMVSNYVCYAEMVRECRAAETNFVFLVDRFFTSTFAYTVGDKAADEVSRWQHLPIGALPLDQSPLPLGWPSDLPRPAGVMFLKLPRAQRVERMRRREREERKDTINEWDAKTEDPALAERIEFCFELVSISNSIPYFALNAAQGAEDVFREARKVVEGPHLLRSAETSQSQKAANEEGKLVLARRTALLSLAREAEKEGLCRVSLSGAGGEGGDFEARRAKHAPWVMQIATPGPQEAGAPSLRSVGVHTVDGRGIVFHAQDVPGGASGSGREAELCSFVVYFGRYPHEQQWRGDGRVAACCFGRALFPAPANLRSGMGPGRCLPFRVRVRRLEVLVGGPSTAAGPKRIEWFHE